MAGGFIEAYGTVFAAPGVAEKGYIDVKIDVTSPGGHSSVPPAHTVCVFFLVCLSFLIYDQTIGYLASLITEFEKNPYPVKLVRLFCPK